MASEIARYADMLAALGAEPRLRVIRLLLSAHPEGLVVGEIGSELGIPPSTLSHHLDKLKNEGLAFVRRKHVPSLQGQQQDASGKRNKAIWPEAISCA
jgi:DNA-binding transcriptional ArsR family regulator